MSVSMCTIPVACTLCKLVGNIIGNLFHLAGYALSDNTDHPCNVPLASELLVQTVASVTVWLVTCRRIPEGAKAVTNMQKTCVVL